LSHRDLAEPKREDERFKKILETFSE